LGEDFKRTKWTWQKVGKDKEGERKRGWESDMEIEICIRRGERMKTRSSSEGFAGFKVRRYTGKG
jgi:hypothetical protein